MVTIVGAGNPGVDAAGEVLEAAAVVVADPVGVGVEPVEVVGVDRLAGHRVLDVDGQVLVVPPREVARQCAAVLLDGLFAGVTGPGEE